MKNVKQVIVARKDIKLKKVDFATFIANASLKFLLENNESDRNDELLVRLSQQEVQWLSDSSPREILGVETHDALQDIAFRAEMLGISIYPMTSDSVSRNKENDDIVCIAIGPDEESVIDQITGHLKSI